MRRRCLKSVTVQVEAPMPRPHKLDKKRMTKKRFPTWVSVGRAKLLYHDSKIVLVRQFGSESLYHPSVQMDFGGFHRNHPQAKNIPEGHGRWRLHPDSVKALADARRA